jgi:4-oxalocrotonate tautomerase
MPIIKVTWFKGRTKEQKAALAQAITDVFVKIANTNPDQTWVVFDDVDKENWAIAGKLSA